MTVKSGKRNFEKLGIRYLLALSAIATAIILSQLLIQRFISQQEDDSREINFSGRQRMLSQRISKCVLLLGNTTDEKERTAALQELSISLEEWRTAHHALLYGDEDLGLKGQNSEVILDMFAKLAGPYGMVANGADSLVNILTANPGTIEEDLRPMIDQVMEYEQDFLTGMDRIVFQYDKEAQEKIARLKYIELLLLAISLGVITFEVFFIFRPSARAVRKTVKKLSEEEAKSRKMAMELSALYSSLEQAYQDLVEVDVDLEDFTVYARCTVSGDFCHFSERFMEVMQMEEGETVNLLDWLEKEGYARTYLESIQKRVQEGNSWNGNVKVVNGAGDFVWLKLNIVPTMGINKEVENLLLICKDETDLKEAEARSQEINREKIEKQVKEQQFRSVLILEGQEEERKRISREIHDGIGQLLTALKYSLEGVHTVKSNPEKQRLKQSKELLLDIITEVRRVSFNLTPAALSDFGIVPVLNKFCQEMTKIAKIPVVFENRTGFLSRLEPKIENNLYRIVQEGVNNAVKYAKAGEIKVVLSHNSYYLNLEIKDDGIGFDFDQLHANGHFASSGHGIFNIMERSNFINGKCEVNTSIGNGTSINIHIPLEE